ncbi:MAG TPA: hypothetical protein VF549_18140 [Solirubrobacteraceae bacterium]
MRFDSQSFLHLRHSKAALSHAWQQGGLIMLTSELLLQRRTILSSARALRGAPSVHLAIGTGPTADEIWERTGPWFCMHRARRPARAVLVLPSDPDEYLRGKARQALRTNVSRAKKVGIECRELRDAGEKRAALTRHMATRGEGGDVVAEFERIYRLQLEAAEVHVAERDGDVEAFSAVFTSGEAAYLVYLRAGVDRERSSAARYALSTHVTQHLIRRGVRGLISGSALGVDSGTAYFQQRLGYIAGNVVLHRHPARARLRSPGRDRIRPAQRPLHELVGGTAD